MASTDWLTKKIRDLDDEAFAEVAGAIAEQSATVEAPKPHDELVHINEITAEINEEYQNWGKVKGLSTGYPTLDEKIGGMGNGHVILIGGETSNGKSALAANIATRVAKTGDGVLFVTLEMLTKEIGSRIMHINGGTVDDLNMMFQAEHRLTYKDLKPLITKAVEYGQIKLIVLDYLQYLGRGMKPEEVAVMSKEIKTLALEFQLPFIVIVSLRKGDNKQKRAWTGIEIEDFMGTGSIGYDADVAMIASRKDLESEYDENSIWVKVLKARNAKLDYSKRFVRFDWHQTRISEAYGLDPVADPFPAKQQGFVEV